MIEIKKILAGQILAAMSLAITESTPLIDLHPMRRIAPPKPKMPNPERQAAAQAKRKRKQADRLRNAALRRGACRDCIGYAGEKIMPYYGHAPHMHNTDGTTTFAPKDQYPANFEPDPESEGLGTWHCPTCGEYPSVKKYWDLAGEAL